MKAESISAQARQFERHQTAYEARIEPHPDHAEQFRLSFPDSQTGLSIVDVSAGGVGLLSGIFIPKNMRLTLHISGADPDRSEVVETLKLRAIVRRLTMIDHKPTYKVGLQFIDPSGADERSFLNSVDRALHRPCETVSTGGGSGS